jgi:hypothetical protein
LARRDRLSVCPFALLERQTAANRSRSVKRACGRKQTGRLHEWQEAPTCGFAGGRLSSRTSDLPLVRAFSFVHVVFLVRRSGREQGVASSQSVVDSRTTELMPADSQARLLDQPIG